ncbi:hypothetical protein [Maricaulis parjimensis]|uniref:hypothetical protein n=1 Tax=Maricaulis parjimensis TaxID=144023 RepID=UPI00193A26AD|nr:hypothetical protein [Maricaulis parjimensis]
MFKQTIRFENEQEALVFDQHMIDFLRLCDEGTISEPKACVFTAHLQEEQTFIRIVQTDSAELLGSFLSFLTLRGFPPMPRNEPQYFALQM